MYIHEAFNTRNERDTHLFKLRGLYTGVVKYSEPAQQLNGTWQTLYYTAYPQQYIESLDDLAEQLEGRINCEEQG